MLSTFRCDECLNASYLQFLKLSESLRDNMVTGLDLKFGITADGHIDTILAEYDGVAFRYMDEIAQRKRVELLSKVGDSLRDSFTRQMQFAENTALDIFEGLYKKGMA